MRRRSGFPARGRNALADSSQNFRRRITGNEGDRKDAAAGGLDFFPAHDLISGPVAALHQHIGEQPRDNFPRRDLIENDNRIHALERGENLCPLARRQDRPTLPFQLAHACVTIQADDQGVTKLASLFENTDVARMQQIEAAIGENDAAAVAFRGAKPHNRFLQSQNRRWQSISMQAQSKSKLSPFELVVYHAQEAGGAKARGAR